MVAGREMGIGQIMAIMQYITQILFSLSMLGFLLINLVRARPTRRVKACKRPPPRRRPPSSSTGCRKDTKARSGNGAPGSPAASANACPSPGRW